MAKDDVLFGYAILDEPKCTISIDDISPSFAKQHKFYCPHCRNEMYATFGPHQKEHFRHNGDKCQHSMYLHDLAEYVFYEEYTKCLDNGWPVYLELRIPRSCNKACVLKQHDDCKEHYIRKTVDLTKEYTLISLETRVNITEGYRRPDVLLESPDGKQLWIEIWVSHETEVDKREDGRIIEIKVTTERDLQKIRQHKIVQSEAEDLAVRIFGIAADGADSLFADDDTENIIYPCEQYYCFESGADGDKHEIIDHPKNIISADLYYRIILRLNWKGHHDSMVGTIGERTTMGELHGACLRRFLSYRSGISIDKSYKELIVSEWLAEDIRSKPALDLVSSYYTSSGIGRHYTSQRPASTPVDIAAMEWVDLGLPSGTLWAKNDIGGQMHFYAAKKFYGDNLPSHADASELKEFCGRKWDDSSKSLMFTGPNGNSISFPCHKDNKTYWLNAYVKEEPGFGQCFHIGPDEYFRINDKGVASHIFVRLVCRP